MILAGVTGFGLDALGVTERAVLPAVLIGMFVAMLVPAKAGCAPAPGGTAATKPPGG